MTKFTKKKKKNLKKKKKTTTFLYTGLYVDFESPKVVQHISPAVRVCVCVSPLSNLITSTHLKSSLFPALHFSSPSRLSAPCARLN